MLRNSHRRVKSQATRGRFDHEALARWPVGRPSADCRADNFWPLLRAKTKEREGKHNGARNMTQRFATKAQRRRRWWSPSSRLCQSARSIAQFRARTHAHKFLGRSSAWPESGGHLLAKANCSCSTSWPQAAGRPKILLLLHLRQLILSNLQRRPRQQASEKAATRSTGNIWLESGEFIHLAGRNSSAAGIQAPRVRRAD